MLGDTPPRLEVDFAIADSYHTSSITLDYESRPSKFHDTIGMFVNTVLIPFAKGVEGGKETLKELNDRWRNDILSLATYDKVSAEGYGCNLCLAFNVGVVETSDSAPKMQPLPTLEERNSDAAQV